MLKVKGEKATEEDKKWLEYGRELVQKSSNTSEDAAKTLITLETTLLTIYVAALTFLKFNLVNLSPYAAIALISFLIYWVISIISNVLVFIPLPQTLNMGSVPAIKQATAELSHEKYKRITFGAISFGIVLFIAIISLFLIAMPPEEEVQIVISKGNITEFDNSFLPLGNGTFMTSPLTLIGSTDKTYLIRTNNGKKVEINKDLVDYIIYL